MIFEIIEPYLEVINLVLAMVMVILGINVMSKLGGTLRAIWVYFLTAIALFGIHEIVGSLEEFGIWSIEGFYAFTEFLFVISILVAIIAFKMLVGDLSVKRKNKK